jgi:hypothetical protein
MYIANESVNNLFVRYKNRLPKQLVESNNDKLANGFIRLCNPDIFKDVLSDGYNETDVIIIGTTVFGDFIVWEKQKYVNIVSFSKHKVTVLASGFDFFFEDIQDENFLKKNFEYELFKKAVKVLGECKDDECYTVNPIPALGGSMNINNLKIGKLNEYTTLCIQASGKIK